MNHGFDWWSFLKPHLWLLALGCVLSAYHWAAGRSRRLPPLPLAWFILYAWGRPLADLLSHDALFPDLAPWARTGFDIVLCWGFIRLALYVAVEWPRRKNARPPMARITRDFLLAVLFTGSALLLLRTRGDVNLAGILTTSAVLTAVIGLAAQATLSNFFAGLAIQFEHPFGLGDWIAVGDVEGEVISITWKSTRLLTRDRHMIYLPNSATLTGALRVPTRPTRDYTVKFLIGLEYDAPPNKVRRVLLDVVRRQPQVLPDPPAEVRLKRFGDFSIDYEVRFTLDDPKLEHATVCRIQNDLWYALRRNQIRIPFPIRDVQHAHIERKREEQTRLARQAGIERLLARTPLLSALPPADLARLAGEAPVRTFAGQEVLIRKGEPGESLYVLLDGSASVRAGEDAASPKVAELHPGDCVGEMSLLTGDRRSATVVAEEDLCVLEIGKALFGTTLQANPGIVERLAQLAAERKAGLSAAPSAAAPGAAPVSLVARIRQFFGL